MFLCGGAESVDGLNRPHRVIGSALYLQDAVCGHALVKALGSQGAFVEEAMVYLFASRTPASMVLLVCYETTCASCCFMCCMSVNHESRVDWF